MGSLGALASFNIRCWRGTEKLEVLRAERRSNSSLTEAAVAQREEMEKTDLLHLLFKDHVQERLEMPPVSEKDVKHENGYFMSIMDGSRPVPSAQKSLTRSISTPART